MDHLINPRLAQVDLLIQKTLRSPTRPLQEMVDHLLSGNGKKIRPMLVLLTGALFDLNGPSLQNADLIKTAASVELIHTASLVHDDIIDGADQRRGSVTLHKRWDTLSAALLGDYLLSMAFKLLSNCERSSILLPLMGRSVELLCRGETMQIDKSYDCSISEQEYYRCNYLKTSQFLAACCEAGGISSVAFPLPFEQSKALREYGFNLGQAFQIVDDILDFYDQTGRLGKPVWVDFNRGVITLPLICLLRKSGRFRALLEAVYCCQGAVSPHLKEQLKQASRECGALEYSIRRAEQAKLLALRSLNAMPQTPVRSIMFKIAESVTARIADIR